MRRVLPLALSALTFGCNDREVKYTPWAREGSVVAQRQYVEASHEECTYSAGGYSMTVDCGKPEEYIVVISCEHGNTRLNDINIFSNFQVGQSVPISYRKRIMVVYDR